MATQMKAVLSAVLTILALSAGASAATLVNNDKEPRTIVVTEGGSRAELTVDPGETVSFCKSGCFVTLPNGDRQALSGAETIEIDNGAARRR